MESHTKEICYPVLYENKKKTSHKRDVIRVYICVFVCDTQKRRVHTQKRPIHMLKGLITKETW